MELIRMGSVAFICYFCNNSSFQSIFISKQKKMKPDKLFTNNKEWVAKKLELDSKYFTNLAKGQSPEFLYIGCSDSRVSAEAILGLEPGEIFVHRNIANLVPNNDLNVMSVINYAVEHLHVKHIIVCGHYNCGGVQAAMQDTDLGILNPWLKNIKDVFRMHKSELDKIEDKGKKYQRLIELNVQEQCLNVINTDSVQKALKGENVKVHGWIFDIHTGKLIDLKIDFDRIRKDIKKIYRLN
jgi:carbonic anhydrase